MLSQCVPASRDPKSISPRSALVASTPTSGTIASAPPSIPVPFEHESHAALVIARTIDAAHARARAEPRFLPS